MMKRGRTGKEENKVENALKEKRDGCAIMENKDDNLIWVDLEMSGLDVDKEEILEMTCIITDANLKILAESPDLVIHQSDEVLNSMDSWCQEHHGKD